MKKIGYKKVIMLENENYRIPFRFTHTHSTCYTPTGTTTTGQSAQDVGTGIQRGYYKVLAGEIAISSQKGPDSSIECSGKHLY